MAFKMKGFSPFTQKVDPDAPGTKGTEGYEPEVKYEDLDEKGKKLWHKVRGTESQESYEKELKQLERDFKANKIGGNELREKKKALIKKYKKA